MQAVWPDDGWARNALRPVPTATGSGVLELDDHAADDAHYDRNRFAEVFAGVKRAPERLTERILAIPGVRTVETRISAFGTLDVEGMAEPVIGRLV